MPSFPDPGLQACFDEQAARHGWQSPADVLELFCPERRIWSLEGIEALTALEVLDVSDNRLDSAFWLTAIHTLRRLDLSGNRALMAYDLDFVFRAHPHLTHIGLRDIAIEDLFLFTFYDFETGTPYRLVELDLRNTGIRSVQFLSTFPTLEVLDLADNDLNYLTGLETLVSLRSLDLSNNRIRFLYELQSVRNLTELRLSGNRDLEIPDINWLLEQNRGLSRLSLAGIPIPDLSSLQLFQPTGEPYALTELDLSDTGIPNTDAVSRFPSLRRLSLAGNALDDDDLPDFEMLRELTSLDLSHNRLRYVVALQALRHLTELRLSGNSGIDLYSLQLVLIENRGLARLAVADIPLYGLWNLPLDDTRTGLPYPLVELDLSNTRLTDTYSLHRFPGLQILNLSKNYISVDLYALEFLPELRELDLSDNRIRQLSLPQTKLTHLDLGGNRTLQTIYLYDLLTRNPLTHLGLSDLRIEDLWNVPLYDELGRYHALVELDLSNTGIQEIYQLSNFEALERLDLSDNRILDLYHLNVLRGLKALDLSRTRVYELWSLWNVRRLRELRLADDLDLDMYAVRDTLQRNPFLERLDLGGLPVGDLESLPLDDLWTSWPLPLVELDLSATGISDIQRLSNFPHLRKLDLSGNAIQLMSALSLPPRLESLDLSHNPSLHISDLLQTRRLLELDLSGNPNIDVNWLWQVLFDNRKLRRLRLRDIPLQDLSTLPLTSPVEPLRLIELDVTHTQIGTPSLYRLWDFSELEVLAAGDNSFTDLSPLSWLPFEHLRELDLGGNHLTGGLNGLRELRTLTHLDLSGNPALDPWGIVDLLSQNPSLTHLDLSGIPFQAFPQDFTKYLYDPYTGLPYYLEKLGVAEAGLTSIAQLSGLLYYDVLLELDLHGNDLPDLDGLPLPVRLRRLDLSDNELSTIFGLTALNDLERLSLSGNPSLMLDQVVLVIENNKGLTHIALNDIPIPDPGVLAPFRDSFTYRILELELDNTKPGDVGAIPNQSKLRVLSLRDNDLVDVQALFQLQYLTRVDLRGNHEIPCVDLDFFESILRPGVVIRPDPCWVPNTPPEVEILSPLEGARFPADQEVVLEARATDAEDGDLGSRVKWSSNISGDLGTGKRITVRLRTAGLHELTARVVDNRGSDATAVVLVDVDPAYCVSRGQYTTYEWIQSVSIGSFSNTSGNNAGYGGYTGLGPIQLVAGANVNIQLTPGFRAGSYTENWNIWIDSNKDGTFGLDEKVFSGVSRSAITGSMTVPLIGGGPTRMRVSMRYGTFAGACEVFTWGEVEDYTINVAK